MHNKSFFIRTTDTAWAFSAGMVAVKLINLSLYTFILFSQWIFFCCNLNLFWEKLYNAYVVDF